jgi:hypothetical protein
MAEIERDRVSDELQACPVPEQVPQPLMTDWLKLLDDPDSRIRKVSDVSVKNQESDTYYLFHPKIPDSIFAVVPLGADPHDQSLISRINGDRYKDGNRVSYYDQGIFDDGTLRLVKVDFGFDGNNPFVAKQSVIFAKMDFPKPIEKGVYEAEFDSKGRLTSYLTGRSTGEYGFQTPDAPHYEDYKRQLHPTKCFP